MSTWRATVHVIVHVLNLSLKDSSPGRFPLKPVMIFGQNINVEDPLEGSEGRNTKTRTTLLTLSGVAFVVLLGLGSIKMVDYGLALAAYYDPDVYKPRRNINVLLFKKDGDDTVLFQSKSGEETEIYRTDEEIFYPSVSNDGKRFAFCKYLNDTDTAIYTKLFDSPDAPVKIPNISPHGCLFSFSSVSDKILYVTKVGQYSDLINCCDLKGVVDTSNAILRGGINIVSPVVENSEYMHPFFYFIVKDDCDDEAPFHLMKYDVDHDMRHYLYKSNRMFGFSVSSSGYTLLIAENKSDKVTILKNSVPVIYAEQKAFIVKAVVSDYGERMYCLICSKKNEDKCKVILVSLESSESPRRMRELVNGITSVYDFALLPKTKK